MSILKRVRDITAANINEILEQSEDPVKVIDRYLHTAGQQIRQNEALLKQIEAHTELMRGQYAEAELLKAKREKQAVLALQVGEEELAKLALQEKLQADERSAQYGALYEESARSLNELRLEQDRLATDYQEVASRRSYYAARMESARLSQQVNQRLGNGGPTGLPGAFNRLEERLSYMEMESRTLRDVRRMTGEAMYQAGTALSNLLDAEIEKLRKKLEQEEKK